MVVCCIDKEEIVEGEAFYQCTECTGSLCLPCLVSHHRNQKTRWHLISNEAGEQVALCQLHHHPLVEYCVDCNECVCIKCKDHERRISLDEKANQVDKIISGLNDTLKEKEAKLESIKRDFVDNAVEVKEREDSAHKLVGALADEFRKSISQWEQNALSELTKSGEKLRLEIKSADIAGLLAEIGHQIEQCLMIQQSSPINMIEEFGTLKKTVEEMVEKVDSLDVNSSFVWRELPKWSSEDVASHFEAMMQSFQKQHGMIVQSSELLNKNTIVFFEDCARSSPVFFEDCVYFAESSFQSLSAYSLSSGTLVKKRGLNVNPLQLAVHKEFLYFTAIDCGRPRLFRICTSLEGPVSAVQLRCETISPGFVIHNNQLFVSDQVANKIKTYRYIMDRFSEEVEFEEQHSPGVVRRMSASGDYLTLLSGNEIEVFDIELQLLKHTLSINNEVSIPPSSLTCCPNGRLIVCCDAIYSYDMNGAHLRRTSVPLSDKFQNLLDVAACGSVIGVLTRNQFFFINPRYTD